MNVFGSPVALPMDSMLVYRECPYLKDMSYVLTNTSPPSGYTAQQLLEVLNPGATYPTSDGAIYVEYHSAGQCVFVNFDLCAAVNSHGARTARVSPRTGRLTSLPGYYYGRVDLMKAILYNLFGLPPVSGGGGTSGVEPKATYKWALGQNSPNPLASGTEIRFEVASASDVSIKVYNAMGQLVKVLQGWQDGSWTVLGSLGRQEPVRRAGIQRRVLLQDGRAEVRRNQEDAGCEVRCSTRCFTGRAGAPVLEPRPLCFGRPTLSLTTHVGIKWALACGLKGGRTS